jgi:hypothetical protein
MLHLSPERLAALADDEPTVAEARHLAGCAFCARERSAYSALLVLARREGARQSTPVSDWNALSARLEEEGMIGRPVESAAASDAASSVGRRVSSRGSWLMRAAAALLIAASGVAYGRYSAGDPLTMVRSSIEDTLPRAPYSSTADAMEAFLRAQRELSQAAAFLAEFEVNGFDARDADVYRVRLAALDGVLGVTQASLYDAPADPVINQLYLASLGAREATVRQISSALPAGTMLTPY